MWATSDAHLRTFGPVDQRLVYLYNYFDPAPKPANLYHSWLFHTAPNYLLDLVAPDVRRGVRRRAMGLRVNNRFWVPGRPHYTCVQNAIQRSACVADKMPPIPKHRALSKRQNLRPLPSLSALGIGPRRISVCDGPPSPVSLLDLTPRRWRAPQKGGIRGSSTQRQDAQQHTARNLAMSSMLPIGSSISASLRAPARRSGGFALKWPRSREGFRTSLPCFRTDD